MSTMMIHQDRVKTIFWLWLFKSFQRCYAERKTSTMTRPSSETLSTSSSVLHLGLDHNTSPDTISCQTPSLLTSQADTFSYTRLGHHDLTWKWNGPSFSPRRRRRKQQEQEENKISNYYRPSLYSSSAILSRYPTENSRDLSSPSQNKFEFNNDDDNKFYFDDDIAVMATHDDEVQMTSVTTKKKKRRRRRRSPAETPLPPSSPYDNDIINALTQPIVPTSISLEEQTGEEFSIPENMDKLVKSGIDIATMNENKPNNWIEWKMHSGTKRLLQDHTEQELLEQGEILVYVGTAKQDGYGSHLPIIKTKAILPMSAEQMADLLMDSTKVQIYNKMSLGRTDVRILGEGTKVVCNLTKPPVAKTQMVSCTLMHSRKLPSLEDGGGHHKHGKHIRRHGHETHKTDQESLMSPQNSYLVISRAAPGSIDADLMELPRNDILLGVNLLEDIGPNRCLMTAVTHVYSPALPAMLAKGMGVTSAINFIRDIRNSCEAVAVP